MLGRTYDGQDCSAARALEIVGERWTLLILRDAIFRNYVRYSQFSESLGVATNVLSKRLETLVSAGLMELHQPTGKGGHGEYHLTAKGRDMKSVIVALTEWGDTWLQQGPVEFCDSDSGDCVKLTFVPVAEGEQVRPSQIIARRRETPR